MPAWARRLVTRAIAVVPALLATVWFGDSGTAQLLILSQVVLSLQLPFAIVPLVRFTSTAGCMQGFASHRAVAALAWGVASVVIAMNVAMLGSLARLW